MLTCNARSVFQLASIRIRTKRLFEDGSPGFKYLFEFRILKPASLHGLAEEQPLAEASARVEIK